MQHKWTGLPTYRRVAESIKERIQSGQLEPGTKLPSNRDLGDEFDVALGTTQRAVRLLQDEGWVVVIPTVGTFVSDEEPPSLEDGLTRDVAELKRAVADLTARLDRLELPNQSH